MKQTPVIILAFVSVLLIASGFSLYAIKGAMTLGAAGLIWVGLMVALFLLYVRFNDIKNLLGKRSTKYGANMVVVTVVFLGIIIFMAFLGETKKSRIDFTKGGRFTLSSQTKKILENLNVPVKAVAFYRSESGTLHAQQRQRARDLLEEYAGLSDKFTFTFVDPDRKPGIAAKYGVSEYRIIMLYTGDRQTKIGNEKEEKFTNALIKLLQKKRKVVYFVKGHGEMDINSTGKKGYRAAFDALKTENYEVRELLLLRHEKVPEDASVVVLASPQKALDPSEFDKLDEYYYDGGAVMAMIDPGHPPTYKTWLEKFGFKLQDDVIIDQQSKIYGASELTPVIYAYHKKHPLTQGFTLASYFPIANSVYIDEDPKTGTYQIALTGPNSWTELDRKQLESGEPEYNEDHEKRGPIPVMSVTTVQAESSVDEEGTKRDRYGKIIVIGDSDFANNTNINLAGNGDLFLNTVGWLAEEADLIAVRAKKSNVTPVVLTASQGRAIFWIPVVMVPSLVFFGGIGIYSRRRWFR